ncbi:Pre-mRNA splicing factor PRP21 like protein-domain-containing protein [Thelephora terrestris]|uniref:Pre-mRNA splicing factor PRP21 like protein-domain-containing protein n=1 Tax=Thelephora terrestris TaxID=56493 RepID=A0A9P6LCI3_9AGAM|nr:Pre-mRNA splicing factor PRP21 like protein-domain-containing protein [Thelephora terrestris]
MLVDDAPLKENAFRFAAGGVILPPPDIKSVIDRTATFVAKSANPTHFEDRIRENQRQDPKFSFLHPADPYHAYYRDRLERVAKGDVDDEDVQKEGKEPADQPAEKPVTDLGKEPPAPHFILDWPNISAVDLDIMKLTALFTARRGHSFLATLSAKEGRNYQFDFLRPNHSLFGYFNRLVDQYSKIINPSKNVLESLSARTDPMDRWRTLDAARQHAKWAKVKEEQDKKRKDDQEAERIAFAEIDWHDYAIVQTIEFTAADANSELPAPMSVQEVENMTLAQKRMAAMVMETTAEDVEAHRARQAAAEAEAAAAVGRVGGTGGDEDAAMEQSDDEEDPRQQEQGVVQRIDTIPAVPETGNIKIRTDYVPKLGQKNQKQTMTACSICGQQVPVNELQEHMRIELLDPRWKSQRDVLEARKAQASELQRGANVVSSLKNLARTRTDIFGAEADEERRKVEEEEERLKRREREKVVWDGHTATKANTLDKYSTNVNFDEQIAAIHRAKGLGPQEAGAIGPGIGPASAPPMPLANLPAPPSLPQVPSQATGAYSAATVSSGPQPASVYQPQPAPIVLPPLHYQGPHAAQPFGYQPPPVGVPTNLIPQTGMVRTADQMDGETPGSDLPPAKRQKVAKLPNGQYYPEADWVNLHPLPISLNVQLPNEPSKPEWKFDGGVVLVPDLPLTLLVSTLRDRILQHTGSSISAGKIRISYEGRMLTNANTIASYNLEEEDTVTVSVRDTKKK